jgi:hypothetical protein
VGCAVNAETEIYKGVNSDGIHESAALCLITGTVKQKYDIFKLLPKKARAF